MQSLQIGYLKYLKQNQSAQYREQMDANDVYEMIKNNAENVYQLQDDYYQNYSNVYNMVSDINNQSSGGSNSSAITENIDKHKHHYVDLIIDTYDQSNRFMDNIKSLNQFQALKRNKDKLDNGPYKTQEGLYSEHNDRDDTDSVSSLQSQHEINSKRNSINQQKLSDSSFQGENSVSLNVIKLTDMKKKMSRNAEELQLQKVKSSTEKLENSSIKSESQQSSQNPILSQTHLTQHQGQSSQNLGNNIQQTQQQTGFHHQVASTSHYNMGVQKHNSGYQQGQTPGYNYQNQQGQYNYNYNHQNSMSSLQYTHQYQQNTSHLNQQLNYQSQVNRSAYYNNMSHYPNQNYQYQQNIPPAISPLNPAQRSNSSNIPYPQKFSSESKK